jgi:hypothetical protein
MCSSGSLGVSPLGVESTLKSQQAATLAWRSLINGRVVPQAIETLQEFPQRSAPILDRRPRPSIYRLVGAGPAGTNIIAKRCEAPRATIEWQIYETVLAYMPVDSPHCYGLVPDADERFLWLFFEDAGNELYSLDREDHHVLAGRWLGVMNVSSESLPAAACLPDRGPGYYRELLVSCREEIRENIESAGFSEGDAAVLRAAVSHCRVLEGEWHHVERVCDRFPRTLVHGDFAVQNARVRTGRAGTTLTVLDWEGAGWGTPATDLAQSIGKALSPDIRTYFSVVSSTWHGVTQADVERLALFGRMLRLICALEWANWGFKAINAGWYMEKMPWCERALAGWIRTALQGGSLQL